MNKFILFVGFAIQALFAYAAIDPRDMYPQTTNTLLPSTFWGQHKKPYPTNAWFVNFVMNDQTDGWSFPVNMFPYSIRLGSEGINISYSRAHMYAEPDYPAIISAIFFPFENQLTLGAQEPMSHYALTSYNGLMVNFAWEGIEQAGFKAPIVQGSPYITAFFSNASPKLTTPYTWLSINGETTFAPIGPATRFELQLKLNGQQQTWLLYSEHPITLQWSQHAISATSAYNGWVRLILQQDSTTGLVNQANILDSYSGNIPLDYKKSFIKNNNQLIYQLVWQTQNGKVPLMLSLPHHRIGNPSLQRSGVMYAGIKGPMLGVTELQWKMKLPALFIEFNQPKQLSAMQLKLLRQSLTEDANLILNRPFVDDGPYRLGKQLAKVAQLIILADELKSYVLKAKLILFLETFLIKKMTTQKNWWFQYDTTWGGIIPSIDDYGARHYNDHHFHYGYWVYAFAVLAHFDKHWLTEPLSDKPFTPQNWIEMLLLDYANSSADNPYFPAQRYQDDYVGHSWASGLKAFVDGQNEQSSSEAVNAYFAAALYAKAMNNSVLYDWSYFLLARELLSAQTYWQVKQASDIYAVQFTKNNAVIANVWGSKVDANAFFIPCSKEYRCGLAYSFGIEMLPFTAISQQLLDHQWLTQAKPIIKKIISNQYGVVSDAWRWLLVKGLSAVMTHEERAYFFQKALESKPEAYDNGDSKTQTLHYLIDN